MKQRFSQLGIVLILLIILFSCKNDDKIEIQRTLKEDIKSLNEIQQNTPLLSLIQNRNVKITSWTIAFYSSNKKLGSFDNYNQIITTDEKKQSYDFSEEQFSIDSQNKPTNFSYTDGIMNIGNVEFIVRYDQNKIYLYYDILDNDAVCNLFNISISEEYKKSTYNKDDVKPIGIIQIQIEGTTDIRLTISDLINNFLNKQEIASQLFNTLSITEEKNQFLLSDGSKELTQTVIITNPQATLGSLTPERAQVIFNAFTQTEIFTFNSTALRLIKLSHTKGGFNVLAKTRDTQQSVKFFYSVNSDKQNWIVAPDDDVDNMNAANFVTRFHCKQSFNGTLYTSVKRITNVENRLILSNDVVSIVDPRIEVQLSNTDIDKTQLNSRLKQLYQAFLDDTEFTFKNNDINIISINHDPEYANAYTVDAQHATNKQSLKFVYNFDEDTDDRWLTAPDALVTEITISAYEIAKKFKDHLVISFSVYEAIATVQNEDRQFEFQNGRKRNIIVNMANQSQIDLGDMDNTKFNKLFIAFLAHDNYQFKDESVKINRIIHQNKEGNNFFVEGISNRTQESIKFFISTNTDEAYWVNAPRES